MPSRRKGSLFSGAATYLFSNVLNAAIPFALLPILTRYLTPAEYGEVAMFQTFLGALGAFVGLNIVGAAGRKYYDIKDQTAELQSFIAACLQILLASALLVFAVVFLFRNQLSELLALKTEWLLAGVLVSMLLVVINLRLGQWQVRGEARRYGTLQVSHSLLNLLLSLGLVVVLLQGAAGRIEAQIGAALVFCLIALVSLHRQQLLRLLVWNPEHLREALRFGVPLIPHVAGAFLVSSVDRIVINAELGLADAGIYMVAVQMAAAMGLVFDALNKAYVPWLFERLVRDKDEEKRQIVRYTYAWFGVIVLAVALAFLIGPYAVRLIAGEQYAAAGEVIGWLALGQGFSGMYLMVTNYIFFSKRTGLLSLATITSGLLNLLLLLVLVRWFGLHGAAIAFSVAMAVRFLLTWWVAQRRHPMPWFDFHLVTEK